MVKSLSVPMQRTTRIVTCTDFRSISIPFSPHTFSVAGHCLLRSVSYLPFHCAAAGQGLLHNFCNSTAISQHVPGSVMRLLSTILLYRPKPFLSFPSHIFSLLFAFSLVVLQVFVGLHSVYYQRNEADEKNNPNSYHKNIERTTNDGGRQATENYQGMDVL